MILSIHAPRSDTYEIFDRIALLSRGEMVYSGPRGDCLAWFSSLGHNVEKGVNPLGKICHTVTVRAILKYNRFPDRHLIRR